MWIALHFNCTASATSFLAYATSSSITQANTVFNITRLVSSSSSKDSMYFLPSLVIWCVLVLPSCTTFDQIAMVSVTKKWHGIHEQYITQNIIIISLLWKSFILSSCIVAHCPFYNQDMDLNRSIQFKVNFCTTWVEIKFNVLPHLGGGIQFKFNIKV